MSDELRELDLSIAREVMELPGAGWYRRASMFSGGSRGYRVAEPHEVYEDHPPEGWACGHHPITITAGRYYLAHGTVNEDGMVKGEVYSVPTYSTRWGDAMKVRDRLVEVGLALPFAHRLMNEHGSWLTMSPEDVCRCALAVVKGKPWSMGTGNPDLWIEARARRVAFDNEKATDPDDARVLLEGAITVLDTTRKERDRLETSRDVYQSIVERIDNIVMDALPMGHVFDHLHQRVRAIVRQRNTLRDLVREMHGRIVKGVARAFVREKIEESRVLGGEYDTTEMIQARIEREKAEEEDGDGASR